MIEFKYPNSACISTGTDNPLIVGQSYDYKENSMIGQCRFLCDESDDEYYKWRFKWDYHPYDAADTSEFVCCEAKNQKFYYSGMYKILPLNSYIFSGRDRKPKL